MKRALPPHKESDDLLVLGIDPGTRVSGYGLIRHSSRKLIPVDYGCIRPPPSYKLMDRYAILYDGILELIARHNPDEVAVETQYVHKNVQSAIKLGMARGIILLAARGRPIYEYAPAKAKKAVVGNGRASKQQVQGMIRMRLQLKANPEPEDAADALALALCHLQSRKYGLHTSEI